MQQTYFKITTYLFNGFCLDQRKLSVFISDIKGKFDVWIAEKTKWQQNGSVEQSDLEGLI